ncbi:hypothetical protein F5Y08DRAFT_352231 [Xylaria arbuscula]|nr:hypothetical protein F5Y08DRAFT_352231 [Xylaria arbuscula]
MADIAIVGLSFKMPGEAIDETSLWEVMENRRNLMKEWPEARFSAKSFRGISAGKQFNRLPKGAHFLEEDLACFDARYFSITEREAAAMDPQQRYVLESSYRAFENAGMTMENLKGSRTAVFAATMTEDFSKMLGKDPDDVPPMALTGAVTSILPNRISWYYDLRGPSVHVDTACSGSMVAVDLACQSIQTGRASVALVTGVNIILTPEASILMSDMSFLSPDGLSYSFDHRANGYGRGEGVVSIVLKPIADAIQDGDIIRAVIRATGTNQDGRSPIITQPSAESQEFLIREVYSRAGLDFKATRYFEAHGTGTPIGDPTEMSAIGRVFGSVRSSSEPLYVGSIKANIGHLEGCSGLASIVKAILILESGSIAPNALFEKVNPSLELDTWNLAIPTESIPWPCDGVRRVSVNSFGFGGTNGHAILDDAYHYLKQRGLVGHHNTRFTHTNRENTSVDKIFDGDRHDSISLDAEGSDSGQIFKPTKEIVLETIGGAHRATQGLKADWSGFYSQSSRILVWSGPDEKALKRVTNDYDTYYREHVSGNPEMLNRLTYTLSARRTHMSWRTFVITGSNLESQEYRRPVAMPAIAKPTRVSEKKGITFVFTGQGSQYVGMGLQLIQYLVFAKTLIQIDKIYNSLGCRWSAIDEIQNSKNIDEPEYSQPLSTAIQIALIELLKEFGIRPNAVVGHSSGEIAAAYAAGALSLESACKISYYRGYVSSLVKAKGEPTAMLSTNLTSTHIQDYIESIGRPDLTATVHVACINSPINLTLSGTDESINILKAKLDTDGIFAQKLKTGVAYHSSAMAAISDEYLSLIGSIKPGMADSSAPIVISTVTGRVIEPSRLSTPQHWVDNLLLPVKFSKAINAISSGISSSVTGEKLTVTDIIEIGPHSALQRPIRDCLGPDGQIRYASVLHRTKPAHKSTLELIGTLFCYGYQVSLSEVNQESQFKKGIAPLINCPPYPFDHSSKHWVESRLSRDYRQRQPVKSDLLGWRFHDWNPLEPRWRNFLSVTEYPWMSHHVVSNTILVPAAGMLSMALDAVRESCLGLASVFIVKEAQFLNAMVLKDSPTGRIETMTRVNPVTQEDEKIGASFDVVIFAYSDGQWRQCFHAVIHRKPAGNNNPLNHSRDPSFSDLHTRNRLEKADQTCSKVVSTEDFYSYCSDLGLSYGKSFQLLKDIRWDGDRVSMARIDIQAAMYPTNSLVHPTVLDTVLQLLLVSISRGLRDPMPANVPVQLQDALVASTIWQQSQISSLTCIAEAIKKPGSRCMTGTIHVFADDGMLLCSIDRLSLAPVSGVDTGLVSPPKLLYHVESEPHLSLLDSQQLSNICDSTALTSDESYMAIYRSKLDILLNTIMKNTYNDLSADDRRNIPSSLGKYVAWMEHYLRNQAASKHCASTEELEELFREVEAMMPSWAYGLAVARNLKPILTGQIDPLRIAFDDGLAERIYANFFQTVADRRFRRLIDLMSHENPCLRILEVGAGTGSWTQSILTIFDDRERRFGASSFSHYTYTDITPSFFEPAKDRLRQFSNRMNFKVFDVEENPAEQGFEPGSYDVVFAGSVLHATQDLNTSVQNVRKLLKPSGYLVLQEMTAPEDLFMNFSFGVLPGWWRFNDKWRTSFPLIDVATWNCVLKENGFSGNELVLKEFQDQRCDVSSVIFSKAIAAQPLVALHRDVLLVVDPSSAIQVRVSDELQTKFLQPAGYRTSIRSFSDVSTDIVTRHGVIVCLAEIGAPMLANLGTQTFESLKTITKSTVRLLWVTSKAFHESSASLDGLSLGFLRTLRTEANDKHIVQLETELPDHQNISDCVDSIIKVFRKSFETESPEVEFATHNGQITTSRLIQKADVDEAMWKRVHAHIDSERWGQGPPVALSIGSVGDLQSFRYAEDPTCNTELGPYEVEIETKAWGLSHRDLSVALGRYDDDEIGSDGSGIIKRIGSSLQSDLKLGDHVCFVYVGSMRAYVRTLGDAVVKIPDSMSFEIAAAVASTGVTAYYSLAKAAQLKAGEKVLIHSAASGTGQMAVSIAKLLGAEVFATVGLESKKKLLINEYELEEDHIFYSRDTSFARGVKQATNDYGVDVVLNSLPGERLRASWECIAPYGRFIELGKADIIANATLPMPCFAMNASFRCVDLAHLVATDQSLVTNLLREVLDLVNTGSIQPSTPIHRYLPSEVEHAFRDLQAGESAGRIVLTPKPSDTTKICRIHRSTWKFDSEASYVIAGGSGGIGLAIATWMASKGARYIIMPSRSGASSKAATRTIAELTHKGVHVFAPKCDVSDAKALEAMLRDYRECIPRIRGCINAAMELQDATFDNMTHEQWQTTIKSKVYTAWNLHRQLPKGMDFFILLSSIAGIIGNASQSNYAAGCTFQDALARQRISRGEKAVSFDLGWMRHIGILAESKLLDQLRRRAADVRAVQEAEFLALLDIYCDPKLPILAESESQLVIGAMTQQHRHAMGLGPTAVMMRPFYAGFSQLPDEDPAHEKISTKDEAQSQALLFRQSKTVDERAEIISRMLARKLAVALAISTEDIELGQPLSHYGVDSLMAVELHNWIRHDLQASISTFELMREASITSISATVASRTKIPLASGLEQEGNS